MKGQQDATKGIWLKARRSKIGEDTSLSGFVGINPRCQGHNWGLLGSNKLKWSPQFILHTYTLGTPHTKQMKVCTLWSAGWNAILLLKCEITVGMRGNVNNLNDLGSFFICKEKLSKGGRFGFPIVIASHPKIIHPEAILWSDCHWS